MRNKTQPIAALTLSVQLLVGNAPASAEDFFQTLEVDTAPVQQDEQSNWQWRGYVQQVVKYGWQVPSPESGAQRNRRGPSQVKTHVFWQAEGGLPDHAPSLQWRFGLKGENEWLQWQDNRRDWRSHNSQLFLKDALIDWTSDDGVWVRLGHQIIAWGDAQSIAITDILSPTDQREPGQAELEDIREQIPAALVSAPVSQQLKFTGVLTWRADANRYAQSGDPFDLLAPYRIQGASFSQADPETEWEVATRLTGSFNGSDIALLAAEINDNELTPWASAENSMEFELRQQRQRMLGLSANRAMGNWLWRTELAWYRDASDSSNPYPWPENRYRGMLGLEYGGWDDWLASFEINTDQTDAPSSQTPLGEGYGFVGFIEHRALRERLTNQWWWLELTREDSRILRWDLRYDINDQWEWGAQLVVYEGDTPTDTTYSLRHQDSVNVALKYSF